jgi:hypothetical protein
VTKNYTSALVRITLGHDYLEIIDQKILNLFPDIAG